MQWLRLGAYSVGSLATTILLCCITGYLFARRGKTREGWYLTGYLGFLCVLLASYTVRYSVFSPAALATGQISNCIAFGVVCLVQFSYHYGENPFRRESRIVLVLSLVLAFGIWGSLFVAKDLTEVYDFKAQYFTFEYGPRISIFTMAGYVWTAVVFVRKVLLFSRRESGSSITLIKAVIRPAGRAALSARSFGLLTIATAGIALLYLLFQTGLISRASYSVFFNTGSMLICLAIFIVYINNSSKPASFMTKLVGIPLAVMLVSFGIASSALMPVVYATLADRYKGDLELAQIVLDAGAPGKIPSDIHFMVPTVRSPRAIAFVSEHIDGEKTQAIINAHGEKGQLPELPGAAPRFFYLELTDPGSYYFAYNLKSRGMDYVIGFQYRDLRLSIHKFVSKIAIAVIVAAIFLVAGFPVIFRRSLLSPLRALLKGVQEVSGGNFRYTLPILAEDEIGQVARGYNQMVSSLKNLEGNFKALAENANDAILILSGEGRIQFSNRRSMEISGYSTRRIRGMHFGSIIHPADLPAVAQRFEERMAGESTLRTYETRVIREDGVIIPVEITGARTIWQEEPADVVIIRDISERKRADEMFQAQQLQLMRVDKLASLGELVAGVAHEVNNPNQAISMNIRFLEEGLPTLFALAESGEEADDDMKLSGLPYGEYKNSVISAVSEMKTSAMRIDHIVKELKRFVRGGSSGSFADTDVNSVVRTVAELSRYSIRKSTDGFFLDLSPDLRQISADHVALEQVILNLLQNACQAISNRSERVGIRTRDGQTEVLIEVIDEGVGIPEEDIPRITGSFFTTKEHRGGTGLGLTVSSRIIREHGGSISFSSKLGQGTTATVRIPYRRDSAFSTVGADTE